MSKTANINNKGAIIAVKTPTKFKKICKFFFTSYDTSLYVHFYGCGSNFYYGKKEFEAGSKEISFNFTQDKVATKCPKLSYHKSGITHFKLADNKETVEQVVATPLDELKGEHIITFHILSLDSFDDCDQKNNKVYALVNFDKEISGLKLTVYGSTDNLDNKYPVGFKLKRGNSFLNFGLNFFVPEEKFENENGFYVLSGWDIEGGDVLKSVDFLYLMSNYGRTN